ncbi:methionyl-tRNA formyltransferase [Acetobacter tropicalis]|uniref:Methionyl-tRNA formyltransferase n=1 Tax=Acetobacter tropicalis TaxID=104102 RepID=A0A095B9R7_9PROT|nr:methionyl-tRNA formyltransferase [Acetobacter tropicalis]KAA8390010.1 methionyl-tRNA formyltransferase [Acetobacter tropicalis]KAA8392080.1 methionyl-tRNA formyltransferase [Acetobacter tropicalis]KGB25533.1 Methionyl-tRNA formyltransferase [Acetobacter tropicalis]MBC9008124.1 methionyl-tRNA formyltransferase [Acetobacter tropicalis]MDO8172737.1 methionyl-tRNA formyltransferase [Acetobacter tropicalis]
MRVIFMGTPDFAVPALHALHAAGHDIVAVYTQPPRPAGRGKALRASPVHQAADKLGLPVRHPVSLRKNTEEWAVFDGFQADVAVVAAYGLILPQSMLDTPRLGCLNIHASLLPRWRGASPIQSAILAGDTESGVTIMQMEAGLDTGPMLLRGAVPITSQTTATSLHDALSALGGSLVVRTLTETPLPTPQPEDGVTYAQKLTREDGRINWQESASAIDRRIRALTPWPGTFTVLNDGMIIKIGAATPLPQFHHTARPGTLLDNTLTVACGEGAVRLTRLQKPGRGMMEAEAFLRGHSIPAGTVLLTAQDDDAPSAHSK